MVENSRFGTAWKFSIKFGTNLSIDVVVASEQAISEAIEKYYSSEVSFDEVMMDFDMDEEDVDFSEEYCSDTLKKDFLNLPQWRQSIFENNISPFTYDLGKYIFSWDMYFFSFLSPNHIRLWWQK